MKKQAEYDAALERGECCEELTPLLQTYDECMYVNTYNGGRFDGSPSLAPQQCAPMGGYEPEPRPIYIVPRPVKLYHWTKEKNLLGVTTGGLKLFCYDDAAQLVST